MFVCFSAADSVNIKILNAGAWSRSSEKVFVSLPTELEDLIPEVEDFYKKNHSGRKLHWHHLMSNGIVSMHGSRKQRVSCCHVFFKQLSGCQNKLTEQQSKLV